MDLTLDTLTDSDSDEDQLQVLEEEDIGAGEPYNKRSRLDMDGITDGLGSGEPAANVTKLEQKSKKDGLYNKFAAKMMAKMGYKEGTGLGKHGQGRVEIVEASKQRGRRGLGLTITGLMPSDEVDWDPSKDEVDFDLEVEWLPKCDLPVPTIEEMRSWKIVGKKKRNIDDETEFCNEEILKAVLSSKSVFDQLESEEMRRARTKSNPYETIRGVFFQNRAAMKMAEMDAITDYMFSNPKYSDGRPMVGHNDLLYFADICAGPGGFSEYILWRTHAEAKGFGMTLKGPCDFKLEEFFAGPSEMFEPHYGVGGVEGDGDIFNPNNQAEFIKFVKDNTDGHGLHMVMADGGFSVEGQENIQEILSKQLYLCQFLVALSTLRPGGHFVCKLFDLFTPFSVGLVYLMYRAFDYVSIFKPVTSRPANSERYIICKGRRSDADPVRQYMHEINLDLCTLSSSQSKEDVNHIVPLNMLQNSETFFNYVADSNDILGRKQVLNLKKIQAFTQNTNLYEVRQADVRGDCLKKWQIPDEVRKAPARQNPKIKFEELVGNEDLAYFQHKPEVLNLDNLHHIKSVYDYRCMMAGDLSGKRCYIIGLGRSHVFRWFGQTKDKWTKFDDLRLELPANTLIEAEVVVELKGEAAGQRKVTTVHALDALFLFGKDVRNLHFGERVEKLRKFVKSITKLTRSDLAQIVVPEVYRLEELQQIYSRLQMKKVKGGGGLERLCYCPKHSIGNRFFRPAGIYIIKTIKDPWTMQLSRSANRKYFFNLHDRQSRFDCPADSIACVRDSKLHSYHWVWDEGVKLLDNQPCREDPNKLSKDAMTDYMYKIMHR